MRHSRCRLLKYCLGPPISDVYLKYFEIMTAYEWSTSRALVSTLLDYTKRQRASVETRPSCDLAYCWVILQFRTGPKRNCPQGGSKANRKPKLRQEKEHERSIKYSRKQPTVRGGSNEIVVEELATARSLLVLRSMLNRMYEEQPFNGLLCLSIRPSTVVVQHLSAGHPVFFLLVPC